MSFGQMLLGNAMDAAFSPGQLHFDPSSNQIVDENGQAYHPSVLARIFSPTASNVYRLQNTSGALNAQQAYNQRSVVKGLTGIDDATYGQTFDPRFSPSNINAQQEAVQSGLLGVPRTRAEQALNMALAGRQEAANEANRATTASLLGTPALSAGVENQGLNYQSGEYAGQSALQPQKFYNLGLESGNASQQLLGQRAAIPYQNQELLNRSMVGAGMSGQSLADLPINTGTQMNQDIANNYLSKFMPDALRNTPFVSSVTPQGVIESNGLNPRYTMPQQVQMQALQRGLGPVGAPHVADSSGQAWTIPGATPPSNVVAPTIGSSTPLSDMAKPTVEDTYRKEKQQEIDDHADALHKAQQADVNHKIALLKAEQARLTAERAKSATPLGIIGQGIGNTLYDIGTGGQYMRDLGNYAGGLIGRAKNYLTSPAY